MGINSQNQCVAARIADASLLRAAYHQVAKRVMNLKAKITQTNGQTLKRSSSSGAGVSSTGVMVTGGARSIDCRVMARSLAIGYGWAGEGPGDGELRSARSSAEAQRRKMTVIHPR